MNIVAGIDSGPQSIKTVLYDYKHRYIDAQISCHLNFVYKKDRTRELKTKWCYTIEEKVKTVSEKPVHLQKKSVLPIGDAHEYRDHNKSLGQPMTQYQ